MLDLREIQRHIFRVLPVDGEAANVVAEDALALLLELRAARKALAEIDEGVASAAIAKLVLARCVDGDQ